MNNNPICPVAPAGAEAFVNQITGHVVWGVLALFVISFVVSIGAILVGRIFNMPHASKAGAMGLAVVMIVAVVFVTYHSFLSGIIGQGCI